MITILGSSAAWWTPARPAPAPRPPSRPPRQRTERPRTPGEAEKRTTEESDALTKPHNRAQNPKLLILERVFPPGCKILGPQSCFLGIWDVRSRVDHLWDLCVIRFLFEWIREPLNRSIIFETDFKMTGNFGQGFEITRRLSSSYFHIDETIFGGDPNFRLPKSQIKYFPDPKSGKWPLPRLQATFSSNTSVSTVWRLLYISYPPFQHSISSCVNEIVPNKKT